MNNTFSLHRTLLYARKHYAENAWHYLYATLALFVILSLFAWYYLKIERVPSSGFRLWSIATMIGYLYYIIRLSCRSHYERRPMILAYTLPATPLEKYGFIWFNTTIIGTLLYTTVLCSITSVTGLYNDNIILHMIYPSWAMSFLIYAGILLACCWGKEYPMKTFMLLLGAFILFYIIYYRGLNYIGININIPFSNCSIQYQSGMSLVSGRLPEQISEYAAYTVIFTYWIAAAWLVGYFKFKERTLK